VHNDLQNLVAWSKEWQMLFNLEKCKLMHLGFPQVDYNMDGVHLQAVSEEKI